MVGLRGVLERRGPIDQRPRGVDARLQVGQLERDGLVAGDRLAEGAALIGPATEWSRQPWARPTPIAPTPMRPPSSVAQEDARAAAALAEQRVVGHAAVLVGQLARVRGVPAHLGVRLLGREAGRVDGHDERAHFVLCPGCARR